MYVKTKKVSSLRFYLPCKCTGMPVMISLWSNGMSLRDVIKIIKWLNIQIHHLIKIPWRLSKDCVCFIYKFSILGFETSFTLKQRCLDAHFTHLHVFKILVILVDNLETNFQDLTAKMGNLGALMPVHYITCNVMSC